MRPVWEDLVIGVAGNVIAAVIFIPVVLVFRDKIGAWLAAQLARRQAAENRERWSRMPPIGCWSRLGH